MRRMHLCSSSSFEGLVCNGREEGGVNKCREKGGRQGETGGGWEDWREDEKRPLVLISEFLYFESVQLFQ